MSIQFASVEYHQGIDMKVLWARMAPSPIFNLLYLFSQSAMVLSIALWAFATIVSRKRREAGGGGEIYI